MLRMLQTLFKFEWSSAEVHNFYEGDEAAAKFDFSEIELGNPPSCFNLASLYPLVMNFTKHVQPIVSTYVLSFDRQTINSFEGR